MKNIIVFSVSGLSKLPTAKTEDHIHLIISKDEQLNKDDLNKLSGKSFEVTIVDYTDMLHLGYEGGKIAAQYPDAEIILPDGINENKSVEDNQKPKRHRRTKAEMQKAKEIEAKTEPEEKKKRHRRTKAEIVADKKKKERAKKARERYQAKKAEKTAEEAEKIKEKPLTADTNKPTSSYADIVNKEDSSAT